jgi:ATP-binding cassette subfamily B protein
MPRFPFFKQLDSMDCGPACLRMIAKWYGKSYSLELLRSKSFITKSGVSMLGISEAAENIGFRTHGYRLSWEQLRNEAPMPCIIHWNQHHFVVVYDIKVKKGHYPFTSRNKTCDNVLIADPAAGLLKYTKEEFWKCWYSTKTDGIEEGTALLLEPTPEFYKQEDEEKNKLSFLYLLNYIRPYIKYILQLMLGMLTASIISLIFPFLTQSLVDTGIGNSNLAFVIMVLVAQLILTLYNTTLN